uniref:Uncharacterized protein n=1 Tax=Ditylenchus dipsaci TaxID=166011 RepID=A0A915D486_9BILA
MRIKLIFLLSLIHYSTAKISQFLLTDEEEAFVNHAEEARANQRPECCPVDKFPVDLRPNDTDYKQYLEEKCKAFNQLQNCPCEEYKLACANIDDFLNVTECMENNEKEANNSCFKEDFKNINSADLCKIFYEYVKCHDYSNIQRCGNLSFEVAKALNNLLCAADVQLF